MHAETTCTARVRTFANDSYPDLGVYLQPDPMHKMSATTLAGAQAYAYASGRPLVLVDPLGLAAMQKFPRAVEAQLDGLAFAYSAMVSGPRYMHPQNGSWPLEHGGFVCEDACGKSCDYYWPKLEVGIQVGAGENGSMGNRLRQSPLIVCPRGKAVRTFHSHPTPHGPSNDDRTNPLLGAVLDTGGTATFYGPGQADTTFQVFPSPLLPSP
jgi:hypothetical protein